GEVTNFPNQDSGFHYSGVWGDYDNDGDLDLFQATATMGGNRLYRNDGANTWTDVTAAPLNTMNQAVGAAWGDADRDGDLDLYVADQGVFTSPTSVRPNKLFLNQANLRHNHCLVVKLTGT